LFLLNPIPQSIAWDLFPPQFSKNWILGLDGKWLRRKGVVMIYRNITDSCDLWWNLWPSESYLALITDLQEIYFHCQLSFPRGVVSDWKGSIVNGINICFGGIPHQRCLAHVSRDVRSLLAKSSPILGTRQLRQVGLGISQIKSDLDRKDWQLWLACWEVFYGYLLTKKSYPVNLETSKRKWWYTHSNIRRAFRILSKDQNCLFEYLSHQNLPSTNNSLEGLNSDVKTKLANHRGMKYWQQYCFIQWYLIFKKVKKPFDLKRLWDIWKKLNNKK